MNIQELIEDALEATNREGMNFLLCALEEMGFYDAPASTKYHGNYTGGLAMHSYEVYQIAHSIGMALLDAVEYDELKDSITIASLLHDVGKAGQFGKPLYIDNYLKSGKVSESAPYVKNNDLLTLDHEIISVVEVTKYINLTEEEQYAIAYHNGLYTPIGRSLQGKERPLQMIIHFADLWESRANE